MKLAALFLFIQAVILTLSPAVRLRSWAADYRWEHWIGLVTWVILFSVLHRVTLRRLPERDPYLLPCVALITGWGLLTIYRLSPAFGVRQTAWLAVSILVVLAGLRLPGGLFWLRRYKYVWLTSGLILVGLTFLFGTYPEGSLSGPRLWLGCCGVYLQPSEPLKLLLIVYLAAYLADHPHIRIGMSQLILPTLVVAGLALGLLIAQRDLGTASIFMVLYTALLFVASEHRRVLIISSVLLLGAAIGAYFFFDVVRLRMDAWLNPWLDPSGRSYQIVQSLISVAAGSWLGRGLGIGSPGLVPVAHSDFIFAAIAEETGLAGTIALLLILALIATRGIRIALCAPDRYQRYLATGLVTFWLGQSILIIGGSLRLLPLTGVTLPFVSYGGSSLLVSFIALLLLLQISSQPDSEPAPLENTRPYWFILGAALLGLAAAALLLGWWTIVRGPDILARQDNLRWSIAERFVPRGSIVDRNGLLIQGTVGTRPGEYQRQSYYAPLGPVVGYSSPTYGQSGLEQAYDSTLRGLSGYEPDWIAWNFLLYGQPPSGLDLRLSLDLEIQQQVDALWGDQSGAVILMNAKTGEILAMSSQPGFDPNTLEDPDTAELLSNSDARLLNRATQGSYPIGTAWGPFLFAAAGGSSPEMELGVGNEADCLQPLATPQNFAQSIAVGCIPAVKELLAGQGPAELEAILAGVGLADTNLQSAGEEAAAPGTADPLAWHVTPLQLAAAAAGLTQNGLRPTPQLVIAMETPQQGWQIQSSLISPVRIFSPDAAQMTTQQLAAPGAPYWQSLGRGQIDRGEPVTWFIGGTLPGWSGTPLALVIALEGDQAQQAETMGQQILQGIIQ